MRRNNLLATAVSVALLTPAAAMAQVDTSEWKCEYCPFEDGYRAEYEAGAIYVTEDAARFGNGTGLDEKGTYADLGGEGRYLKDGTEVTWYAEDLGLDSRVFEFGVGKPGKYGVDFGYRGIPYRLFDTTSTPFSGSGDTLGLPAGWTTAGTTGGMTDLAASLMPHNIEKDREILEFGANYLPSSKVGLYADYSRQQRDGTSIMSGSFFGQAANLPRPVDDYTDRFDAGIRYANGPFNMTLAYYGSFYRNELESLTWDNPFTPLPGADQGRLALEPDNDFQQFSFSGAFRATTWDSVFAFSAAIGRGEQNVDLLPYTINPTLPVLPTPVSSIDGQVDTSNYALTWTARPHRRATLRVAYRYDERDNKTPVNMWERVITDGFSTSTPEPNIPYSFERGRFNLSANYRLFDTLTISGGYDRTDLDRDFQEVASQTEDTGWGKLRWRPTPNLEATFKGGASSRDVDEYDTDVGLIFGQNPLMRKYNLAYRYRKFAEVGLSASLANTPLSIGMTYLYADDSYSRSELGMQEATEDRFTVDFSWAVGERSSIYVTAGSESIDAVQLGSEMFAGPVWEASHDDDFTHYGGGFRVMSMSDKLDLTFDYTRGEGETEILFVGQTVAAEPLPDLESTMDSLRLALSYNVSERFSINAQARWERFEAQDWGLQDVAPDTIPSVLTMGASPYDYDVWAFGIGFTYRVGGEE